MKKLSDIKEDLEFYPFITPHSKWFEILRGIGSDGQALLGEYLDNLEVLQNNPNSIKECRHISLKFKNKNGEMTLYCTNCNKYFRYCVGNKTTILEEIE